MLKILKIGNKKIWNFYFGLYAEYLTIIIYAVQFYRILHHRLKTFGACNGEIDLVVLRGKTLVFIEVKARSTHLQEGIVPVSQQQRIVKSARWFLARYPRYQNHNIRFDVVFVQKYKLPIIIKNAW